MHVTKKTRSAIKRFLRYSLFACCLISTALAEATKEQQVKISFIYNFAKFITWPTSLSASTPFNLCVLGEQPLSGNIGLLQGRVVNDHTIAVQVFPAHDKGGCQILFIGNTEAERLPVILHDIAALPVLSISDMPDFVHAGGIIGMKVIDDKVRFDINLAAAYKAGLAINSQLLKLATEVLQ